MSELDDLENSEELFEFLQGNIPSGYHLAAESIPRLTPEQAWTVIWYLQNKYWQVPDHIERCDICGNLYDSWREGETLDFGKPPHFVCDGCTFSYEATEKRNTLTNKRGNQ